MARGRGVGEWHRASDFAMMTSFPPLAASAPWKHPVPTGPSPARDEATAMRTLLALLLTTGLATPAAADATDADIAVRTGAEHTVETDPSARHWQLRPLQGSPLELTLGDQCPLPTSPLPRGLWLLTRDAQDRPVLLAPSATPLPAGHPGLVMLDDCDADHAGQPHRLAVPTALNELLASHGSAVLVK